MLKSQLDMIEQDYKLLSSEFKKKSPQIKESCDVAIANLAKYKQDQQSSVERQNDYPTELLEPLAAIFQGKFVKTFSVAMNCLNKILWAFNLSPEQVIQVLTMLKFASGETIDEMTQIRVLQMLLTFLDPKKEGVMLSKEFTNLVLSCCFQLFESKSNPVKSSIQATMRQLLSIIHEKFMGICKEVFVKLPFHDKILSPKKRGVTMTQEQIQQTNQLFESEVQQTTAYKVLHDLIANLTYTLILSEQTSKGKNNQAQQAQIWNLKPTPAAKCVIMDLLCECLVHTGEVLQFSPVTLDIFKNQVVPIVDQALQQKTVSAQQGLRQLKLAILVVSNLGVGVHLMNQLLGELEKFQQKGKDGSYHFQLNWRSLISFECVNHILSNLSVCQLFSQTTLTIGVPILLQFLESLDKACQAIETNLSLAEKPNPKNPQNEQKSPVYSQQTQKVTRYLMSSNNDQEIASPSLQQIHRLIIESVCSLPKNFQLMLDDLEREENLDITKFKNFTGMCCKPLKEMLERLLVSSRDDQSTRLILQAYQDCIGACGGMQYFDMRDSFIGSLCKQCLPESSGKLQQPLKMTKSQSQEQQQKRESLSVTNIQVCKTLLNIVYQLGHILDVKSWYNIFEILQKVDKIIEKTIQNLTGAKEKYQNQSVFNKDGQQQLVNFADLKAKVHERIRAFENEVEKKKIEKERTPCAQSIRMSVGGSHHNRSATISQQSSSMADIDESSSHHKRMQSNAYPACLFNAPEANQRKTSMSSIDESPQLMRKESSENPVVTEQKNQKNYLNELQSLRDLIDSLFASTVMFNGQTLAEMTCAMAQLAVGVLDSINGGTGGGPKDIEIVSSHNLNMFAITRLVETVIVNVSRCEHFWKTLVAHFDFLAKSRVIVLRQVTIEALQLIILEIFAHKKAIKQQKIRKQSNDIAQERGRTDSQDECKVGSESDRSQVSRSGDGNEEEDSWSKSVWQYTLLLPLTELLKLESQQDKVLVLKSIEKIIQTCGQQIENEGWRIITVAISVQIENEQEQVVACGFRCLKLIVSNYINMLSQQNFITLLNAIHMYAANTTADNINNNLTAIGLFQNVADFTSQQLSTPRIEQRDQTKSAVDQVYSTEQIWSILFARIQSLGDDHRAEVRRTNVITLENIVMRHGKILGPADNEVWTTLMSTVLHKMLKTSIEKYQGGMESEEEYKAPQANQPNLFGPMLGAIPSTPSFNSTANYSSVRSTQTQQPSRKMKFDEASIVKALEKTDSQWEDTCCSLLQTSCRVLKKYLDVTNTGSLHSSFSSKHKVDINAFDEAEANIEDDVNDNLATQVWSLLVQQICKLLNCSQGTENGTEVVKNVFKAISDLLSNQKGLKLFLQDQDQSFLVLVSVQEFFQYEKEEKLASGDKQRTIKQMRAALTVVETLYKIYTEDGANLLKMSKSEAENPEMWEHQQSLMSRQNCQILFNLMKQLVNISNNADGFTSFAQTHKLNTEERTIFDFIEYLNSTMQQKSAIQSQYLHFLLDFTEFRQETRSEAFIRRTLSIINTIVLKGALKTSVLIDFLPVLYDRLVTLIELRYNTEAVTGILFQSKKNSHETLFYTVGLFCIHMSSFLINPTQFKQRLEVHLQTGDSQNSQNREKRSAAPTAGSGEQNKVKSSFGGQTSQTDLLFSETSEFQNLQLKDIHPEVCEDLELRRLAWRRVVDMLESCLIFKQSRMPQQSGQINQEIVKSSQDLDLQVMCFVINCLLPNTGTEFFDNSESSLEQNREFEKTLVRIIDMGCGGSKAAGISDSAVGGTNLSTYCLSNLFELCRYEAEDIQSEQSPSETQEMWRESQEPSSRFTQIKRKIASITTPVLINRSRLTLKRYCADEMKLGQKSIARTRTTEVIFILDKLRQLDSYPNFENEQNERKQETQSKKGHLTELMPIFADMILTNDSQIKESLRQIFHEISLSMNTIGQVQNVQQNMPSRVSQGSSGGELMF